MSIESIDIVGDIARVRARVVMLGFDYVDLLGLARHEGRWSIVQKLFTHVGA
jgi:Putative lumazine-binding